MKMKLEHGRPEDVSEHQDREPRVYDLLGKFLPAVHHTPRMVTLENG